MKEYIERLRKEATSLRGDTLVSINEEIRNEAMAEKLETIADELEVYLPKSNNCGSNTVETMCL